MTKHNHAVVFGRLVDGCARCAELQAGAKVRSWGARRAERDRQFREDLRRHSCAASHCGPVCTFGDY